MTPRFRAAVVQAGAVPFDSQRSLEKACRLVSEAAGQGAKLVVFPEAFISAYPKGLDFGARVGMRFPEGRDMFRRYFESAIEVPGSLLGWIPARLLANLAPWRDLCPSQGPNLYLTIYIK